VSKKNKKRNKGQKRQHKAKRAEKKTLEQKRANTFADLLESLPDEQKPLGPNYLFLLNGLSPKEVKQLQEVWPRIPLRRRRAIMEDASALSDESFTVNLYELGKLALADPDPQVRFHAISTLWGEDDRDVTRRFVEIATTDPDPEVRANAVSALSNQMFLGAVDSLSERLLEEIESALFGILEDEAEDERVRRRALETLGYSQQRERIDEFIHQALQSTDDEWLASALRAIGNTMDEDEWGDTVLRYFDHVNPKIRSMAARAAGMLGLEDAVPKLLYLLRDADADVRMMAAWALSEIGAGGERVKDALKRASRNAASQEEREVISEAIDNFTFNAGLGDPQFLLLAFSEDELAEMMHTLSEEELEEMEENDMLPWLPDDFFGEDDEE